MKVQKIALIGSALVLAIAGVTVAACSSSSSPSTSEDSGTGGGSSGGGSSSGGTTEDASNGGGSSSGGGDTGDAGSSGDDAACAKPPALHVPAADGGLYCPYSYNDATDAGIQYCSGATPLCCVSEESDAGPSTCAASCPSTTYTWQCSAPSDCANSGVDGGGSPIVCCLVSGAVEADSKCTGYQKTEGLDSVTCTPASQCAGPITVGKYTDTHYVACEQQSDCTASAAAFGGDGGTCTAVFTSGTPIGLCL